MPSDFFRIERGLELDNLVQYLQGSGVPGAGDTSLAPVGSVYTDNSTGALWTKLAAGSGSDKWQKLATEEYVNASGAATTLVAQQALGGHRVVIAVGLDGADYADATNVAHAGRVAGITTGAASALAPVTIKSTGAIDEPSWSWVPDTDIWLSTNGLMTQTPPTTTAFTQRVGFALTPTRIWVDLSEPILSE